MSVNGAAGRSRSDLLRKLRTARAPRGLLESAFYWSTGEWHLRNPERPNGGPVILVRTLVITLEIYVVALVALNVIDPSRAWTFDAAALQTDMVERISWPATIFAGVYVALYTRFSAQWTYLAGVYNQIKQVEAAGPNANRRQHAAILAQWKAGFIEDADLLHLAAKPSFASIILLWGNEHLVRSAFASDCSGGNERLSALIEIATRVHKKENGKWNST